MSIWWDVHTLPSAGPIRHYQKYPDQSFALRMAGHLVDVLHLDLVVEPVELPEPMEVNR